MGFNKLMRLVIFDCGNKTELKKTEAECEMTEWRWKRWPNFLKIEFSGVVCRKYFFEVNKLKKKE